MGIGFRARGELLRDRSPTFPTLEVIQEDAGLVFLGKVHRWWSKSQALPPPFAIPCACGQVVRGRRQQHHQVVTCPACGRRVFVLPRSPFDTAGPAPSQPAAPDAPAARPVSRWTPWLWPILAGSGTCLVAGAVIFLVVRQVQTSRGPRTTPVVYQVSDVDSRVQSARQAVAAGDLAQAAQELAAAQEMVRTRPDLLSAADARRLTQLQRQVALVADWEREPLEHLLRRIGAAQLNESEWQTLMARYRGKAMIFDRAIRRDLNKQVHVEGHHSVRLELHNFKLLERLPLTDPQRLLFAARLADIQREPDGGYRVTLEPDSGVLLTDADIASKCFPHPLDAPMQEVLKKQASWAALGP